MEGSSRTELMVLLSSAPCSPKCSSGVLARSGGTEMCHVLFPSPCVCSPQPLALVFILFLVLLTVLWKVRMFLVLPEMLT